MPTDDLDPQSAQKERFLLKELFNRDTVGEVAGAVGTALPGFDGKTFESRVFDDEWPDRVLKQRMRHVTTVLHGLLPGNYRRQLSILLAAANLAPKRFAALVFSDFVEVYGTGDWDASVPALAEFTRLESAEFAIRPFIARYPERTMAQMLEWAGNADPAVRRLASEGCRPRLPWAMRLEPLVADPGPILPILERLRHDPDESVRRSVANNLNDIAKDHPQVVTDLLRRWDPRPGTDLYRLASHALRTLLKRGDRAALEVLGFTENPPVKVDGLALEPSTPAIGGSAQLTFSVESASSEPQQVLVGYAIHFVKAAGRTSAKVFRLGSVQLKPGQPATFIRKLAFHQMTTRVHRPGVHRLEVLANGSAIGSMDFELRQ
jgi:3-methyladenine DNA glycosylase AlkC